MKKITVFSEYAPEVEKIMKRMERKAARYGVRFSFERGEEYAKEIAVQVTDGHVISTVNVIAVSAVDFYIDCDGLIKAGEWIVRAKVEHGDEGNIVTPFGVDALQEWYDAAPRCEHCGTNRARGTTFFVQNNNGEFKQVGRTCLKDYTGINPAAVAMWAEVNDIVDDVRGSYSKSEFESLGLKKMHNVKTIISHACDVIAEYGYRKSEEPGSTKLAVISKLDDKKEPSEDGKEKAEEIIKWLKTIDRNEKIVGDIEKNCIVLANSGYAKTSHVGILAYMPIAYERYQERKARMELREKERKAIAEKSNYVGVIGKRIELTAEKVELVTSWETEYGTTRLYKFTDEDGNVFVWFASKILKANNGTRIRGTVKNHSERDGIKQTVLTRCAIVASC